jgi:hypothetical protein
MQTTTEPGPGPDSSRFDEAGECARLTGRLMDGRMFWDLWFSLALLPWAFATRESDWLAVAGSTPRTRTASGGGAVKSSLERAPVRGRGSRQGNVFYVDFR